MRRTSHEHIRRGWTAIVAIHIMLMSVDAFAQNATAYTPNELRKHFQDVAASYEMKAGSKRLTLREQPLMFWQNTVRQQEQGALYMWTLDGHPQVLCSVFTFQMNGNVRCRHEAISLADGPVTSRLDSATVWSPKKAGVQWKEFDGAAAPTESQPRRLTQMRAIARQFTATLNIPGRQLANLKLIPQPLVRYAAPDSGVIDGAIFSLAVVTDPEVLLLVEARESAGGSTAWYYSAARAHYHELVLRRKDQMVWNAPPVTELANTRAGQLPFANDPYFIFFPPNPLPAPEELR